MVTLSGEATEPFSFFFFLFFFFFLPTLSLGISSYRKEFGPAEASSLFKVDRRFEKVLHPGKQTGRDKICFPF